MEKSFNKMKEYHKFMEEMFRCDMSCPLLITITIFNDKALLTNNRNNIWGKEINKNDLGKEIAEDIMLSLETPNTEFGGWAIPQNLPDYKKILELKEEDFVMNIELQKLWQICRIICNNKNNNTIYHISYDTDTDYLWVKELKNEEEINEFLDNYVERD